MTKPYIVGIFCGLVIICNLSCHENIKFVKKNTSEMEMINNCGFYTDIVLTKIENSYALKDVAKINKINNIKKEKIDPVNYIEVKGLQGKKSKFGYKLMNSLKIPGYTLLETTIYFDEAIDSLVVYRNGIKVSDIIDEDYKATFRPRLTINSDNKNSIEWLIENAVDSVAVYEIPSKKSGPTTLLDLSVNHKDGNSRISSKFEFRENPYLFYFVVIKGLKVYISFYSVAHGFVLNPLVVEKEFIHYE